MASTVIARSSSNNGDTTASNAPTQPGAILATHTTTTTLDAAIRSPTSHTTYAAHATGDGFNVGSALKLGIAIVVFVVTIVCTVAFVCYRRRVRRKARDKRCSAKLSSGEDGNDHYSASEDRVIVVHELNGKSQPGELETRANRHEIAAGNFRGRRYELGFDSRP